MSSPTTGEHHLVVLDPSLSSPPAEPVVVPGLEPPSAWAEGVATWTVRAMQALLVWLVLGLVLMPFAPRQVRMIGDLLSVLNVPTLPTFGSIVLVVAMVYGVTRRLRIALWFIVVVWQGLNALLGPLLVVLDLSGVDAGLTPMDTAEVIVSAGVALVVIVIMVSARSAFPARLRRGALFPAVGVLVAGLAVSTFVGMSLLQVFPGRLHQHDQTERLRWVGEHATGFQFGGPGHGPIWLGLLVGLLGGLSLVAAIAVFLRSGRPDLTHRRDDDLAVRDLLLRHGEDSLGYFATRADRSVRFSQDRRAAISYRVISGVALAAGDPLGDPASWADAIARWLTYVRAYGWIPAVTSTSEAAARAYRTFGFRARLMGDEAVIVVREFDLDSPALRPVRRTVDRPRDAGYTVRVRRQADVPAAELAQLVAAADVWRHGDERGYSMALDRLGAAYDPREVVVAAYDADGLPRGVLSFVPWGRRGLSLDVMRRSPDALPGVTELMVTELVTAARTDLGVDRISMNFAMFRETFEAGDRIYAGARQRFARWMLRRASRIWQLESLYRSNEKYLPTWRPRLLCYQSPAALVQVLIALGRAEGFVPEPPALFERDATSGAEQVRSAPDYAAAVVEQEHQLLAVTAPVRTLSQQQRARRRKLTVLREAGMAPYPVSVPRTAPVGQAHAAAAALPADAPLAEAAADASTAAALPGDTAVEPGRGTHPDTEPEPTMSVVGRVVLLRDLGGVVFAVLREGTDTVQPLLSADAVADLALFGRVVDLGDQISVTGRPGRSRSGEPSLLVHDWCMASKALTPPPDKYRGLVDPETRIRLRHVDLALDTDAATRLRARSAAVRAVRTTLDDAGFVEVETPVLQRIHGGANARPFRTHINAYDVDLYLRIAPELYLKRLMVGGVGRVFELGRNFRNEGADSTHNPEFTSLEAYQAYGDYDSMRLLTQDLVRAAAVAVHGEPVAHAPDGSVLRLDGPDWRVVTVHDAVAAAIEEHLTVDTPLDQVRAICERHQVAWTPLSRPGELVAELYDRYVEKQTVEPTFYIDFPVETSPLTRAHRRDPRLAERWDLVCFGAEIGTAYSELVDPVDQRDRLTAQSVLAAAGDPEAMELDEEFLSALEFGMPPTGGLGIGVDRLVMMLLGVGIRDVLSFPFVRPSTR